MSRDIIKPLININGATAESHIAARIEALHAIYELQEKMRQLMPHPRDYQTKPEMFEPDFNIHRARVEYLHNLRIDLENEGILIQDTYCK